jgi:hypothetical protein
MSVSSILKVHMLHGNFNSLEGMARASESEQNWMKKVFDR